MLIYQEDQGELDQERNSNSLEQSGSSIFEKKETAINEYQPLRPQQESYVPSANLRSFHSQKTK
jgi:hypothetical protein